MIRFLLSALIILGLIWLILFLLDHAAITNFLPTWLRFDL